MDRRVELTIGTVLFVGSILALFALRSAAQPVLVAVFAVQWFSVLVLVAAVDRYLFGRSVFEMDWRERYDIVIGTLVFHAGLVFFGGALTTTQWYYPTLDPVIYTVMAPLGYVLYGLALYGIYETVDRYLADKPTLDVPGWYPRFMQLVGGVGVLLLVYTIQFTADLIVQEGIVLGAINTAPELDLPVWFFFAPWIAMFMTFEGVSFVRGRDTLTLEVINGNHAPLLASLIASALGIAAIEIVNVPFELWTFINWPYQQVQFLGLPVFVYLSWPFQFPAFLAVLRSLFPSEDRIW